MSTTIIRLPVTPTKLKCENRLRFTRQAGTDANERLQIGFAESRAAAVKHNVVAIEKTMGTIKKNFHVKTVMAAKQNANAHAVLRMCAKDSGGRPPSCHANTTASRRKTLTKSPNPT